MDEVLTTLTLQQIYIFMTVVEENGFARAGRKLYMTQPAVSKSIAKMEKNLGFLLFTRTTRSHALTEAGRMLYEGWKPHLEAMDRTLLQARDMVNKNEQTLTIGLLNTARPERYFFPLLAQMQKKRPEVTVQHTFGYITDLEREMITWHQYDLIMVPDFERYYVEAAGLSYCYAAWDHMYLLVSKEHPLAKRRSVCTEDFAGEPMIEVFTHEDMPCYFMDLVGRLKKTNKEPNVVRLLKSAYDVQYFAVTKDVVRLVDNYFDDSSDEMNVKKIKIKDQFGGVICVWNPENPKACLRDFLELLPEAEKDRK